VGAAGRFVDSLGRNFIPLYEFVARTTEYITGNRYAGPAQALLSSQRVKTGWQRVEGPLDITKYIAFRGGAERVPYVGMSDQFMSIYGKALETPQAGKLMDELIRLRRVQEKMREDGKQPPGWLGQPSRTIAGQKLSDKAYSNYMQERTRAVMPTLYKLVTSTGYQRMSDTARMKAIGRIANRRALPISNKMKKTLRRAR